ncbi:MAG TPA: ATP-grasp domain-containing protein [Methanoregulaceae archaeon]|nr:MAG: ATP-grasp domain-containing protein [Methanolinea sp.]HON81089.1 ATP-grasp domain-containing protein [Methanoregulaceae archaeon]HPD09967.1 ATP-grasp domain-containing protein [Methanoregulaceae archaeon]HRT14842.1 ATP-grasp domain-containing protein [Methanoregulaceae archaeon]HRU30543.1 ATP-grasp domain-containing protein [Methanoregulaceae archaeon]
MGLKVLVAGFSTRHVAQSAFAAGYEVYAVDHFSDRDLSLYTRESVRFDEIDGILPAVEEMARRHAPDIVIATSGAELLPSRNLYGTAPEKVQRFLDKLTTHQFFDEIGVRTPMLLSPHRFPAMLKPRRGSGGWRNRIVSSATELEAWRAEFNDPPALAEEVVSGAPCSVCCIADGTRAVAIAANRQMLRGSGSASYGYCGSVTPFLDPRHNALIQVAERIASASGCVGTLGIDFIAGDELYAIEINPRFQATLDTVEMATGINLFSLHLAACRGSLPAKKPSCLQVSARKILFADRSFTMHRDLSRLAPIVSDIPWPGTAFEEGQAVISVYGWGSTEGEAMRLLHKHFQTVRQYTDGRLYG